MIEGGSNAAFFVFGYNPNETNGGHFHTFLAARARLGESFTFTFSHFHATMWENTAYDAVLIDKERITTAFYVNFQIFYLKNCIFLIFLSIFAIFGCIV